MKKAILPVILLALIGLSASGTLAEESIGLATGCLTTADAADFGVGYVGGFAGFGDDVTSVFGTVTYGFSDYTEGRLKFGFADLDAPNTDPQILLGVDMKYELMDYYDKLKKNPFDLAVGGFIEYVDYENYSTFELGANVIGSLPFKFNSGHRIIPYSRFNIRWERYSANDDSDSNFRLGANFGGKFEVTREFSLYAELQIDGNSGLFTGLEFRAF
nr:hypothetical protein [candidate division Zixibacteria bacterium]